MNQIWEYKILKIMIEHWELELNLNILGQGGWELITAQSDSLIFKRKTLPISLTNHTDPQPVETREEI